MLILERLVCSGIFVFKTQDHIYYLLFMIKTYLNILDSWNILKKNNNKKNIRGKKERKGNLRKM